MTLAAEPPNSSMVTAGSAGLIRAPWRTSSGRLSIHGKEVLSQLVAIEQRQARSRLAPGIRIQPVEGSEIGHERRSHLLAPDPAAGFLLHAVVAGDHA